MYEDYASINETLIAASLAARETARQFISFDCRNVSPWQEKRGASPAAKKVDA